MEQLLRDPVWQFVGVLVAFIATIIAIIVPVILARKQRQKKNLEYLVLTSMPIFNPSGEVKFQLLFEQKPVHAVQLVILRIVNTGNLPIVTADYHERVSIEFAPESHVLSAEIAKTFPERLHIGAAISANPANRVFFQPVLLNGGDWFTVKLLVASFKDGITMGGRICGIKQIAIHANPALRSAERTVFGLLGVLLGFVLVFFDRTRTAGFVLMVAGYLWSFGAMTHYHYRKRRDTKLFG